MARQDKKCILRRFIGRPEAEQEWLAQMRETVELFKLDGAISTRKMPNPPKRVRNKRRVCGY